MSDPCPTCGHKPRKPSVSKRMTKDHCSGCEDNFYNGNNPYGVQECWMFKSAKLIMRKQVHIDQRPPWNQKAQLLPSCYHQKRYICVKPDQTN